MQTSTRYIKQNLIEHYNADAAAYHAVNYQRPKDYSPLAFRQRYIEQMLDSLSLPAGSKILDVGCGPGELVLALTRQGFDTWGIDISESMIERAQDLLAANKLYTQRQLGVGDIENLSFGDEFFDVVVASGVIEYQPSDDRSLSEMYRTLKPGGSLVLNVTVRYSYMNWLDNAYRWLKRHKTGWNAVSFIKESVLQKGSLHHFPERRTHRPGIFDQSLRAHGFEKVSYRFFHFSPLPSPLDSTFTLCKNLGMRMEGLSDSPLGGLLAGGYIVHAMKKEQSRQATFPSFFRS
jgi:ubiquinone/menaquinone biosynthesis C-methylase UbiE